MNNHRYILEAIQLLQHHKVKKRGIPVAHKLLDISLALIVYGVFVWGIIELILWLLK